MTDYIPNVVVEDAHKLFEHNPEYVERLSGSHILITGANGFLCSYLIDLLFIFNRDIAKNPVHVCALDNLLVGSSERLAYITNDPNFNFIQHDITTPYSIPDDINYIIHGATIASPIFYRRYPLETLDANVKGVRLLLDAGKELKDLRNFIFFSSSEIYGDPDPAFIPTPETYLGNVSCTGPRACYDESKRMGETLCTIYQREFDLPINIIRPFNVYGPGQRLDDQRIIPDLMVAALANDPIVLFSDGSPTRSFCYIRDFMAGLLGVMTSNKPGDIYNLGNDTELSIKDAALTMAQVPEGDPLDVRFETSDDTNYLSDNPNRRCPDLTKIKTTFGWEPKVTLKEGLKRTYNSYIQRAHK